MLEARKLCTHDEKTPEKRDGRARNVFSLTIYLNHHMQAVDSLNDEEEVSFHRICLKKRDLQSFVLQPSHLSVARLILFEHRLFGFNARREEKNVQTVLDTGKFENSSREPRLPIALDGSFVPPRSDPTKNSIISVGTEQIKR